MLANHSVIHTEGGTTNTMTRDIIQLPAKPKTESIKKLLLIQIKNYKAVFSGVLFPEAIIFLVNRYY